MSEGAAVDPGPYCALPVGEAKQPPDRRSALRFMLAGALAATLWVASWVLLHLISSGTPLGRLPQVVLPETAPGAAWHWPEAWGIWAVALGSVVVALVATLLMVLRRDGASSLIAAWFALIVAGAFAGGVADIALIVGRLPRSGLRAALMQDPGAYATAGAYWGLLQGWLPALVHGRRARGRGARGGGARPSGRERAGLLLPALLLLLALCAAGGYGVVTVQGMRAAHVASVQEAAIAEGASEDEGLLPDPYAEGDPVPSSSPAEGPRDPAWCTPEEATLLLGDPVAATGHRVLPLRIMNFSEEPCVVEGYPDVAFADQNGHLLDAVIEHGDSFMVRDPAPQPVEVPAGGYAVAYLGWNANSTHGALVATTVHAAQVAGDTRGSWSGRPPLDIVAGSSVAVTAWAPDEGPQPD